MIKEGTATINGHELDIRRAQNKNQNGGGKLFLCNICRAFSAKVQSLPFFVSLLSYQSVFLCSEVVFKLSRIKKSI